MSQKVRPEKFWNTSSLHVPKCPSTPMLFTNDAHQNHYSVKSGSISFLSSSGIQKFHHLLGCHATGINSLLTFFKIYYVKPKI